MGVKGFESRLDGQACVASHGLGRGWWGTGRWVSGLMPRLEGLAGGVSHSLGRGLKGGEKQPISGF